jgi:hypothetical protein
MASALIDERIAYDLAQALATNARYEALQKALQGAPETQKESVFAAAGCWPIKLYLVQPDGALEGGSFSGFLSRDLRAKYVAAGKGAILRPL